MADDKPRNLKLYWETLKTEDGEAYYFCAETNETTYDNPLERGKDVILLPEGWQAFAADDGEPYFSLESTGETSWDFPEGTKLGKDAGGKAKDKAGASDAGSSGGMEKVDDLRLYYTTFIDADNVPYYFQEATGTNTYDKPDAPVKVKGSGKMMWPMLLPVGWDPLDTEDGQVYFAHENGDTTWDLPKGTTSCEPAGAAKDKGKDEGKAKEEGKDTKKEEAPAAASASASASAPATAKTAAKKDDGALPKAGRVIDKDKLLGEAMDMVADCMAAWKRRKEAGDPHPFKRRPVLFRRKDGDEYLVVNGYEVDLIKGLLKDTNGYERLGCLSKKEHPTQAAEVVEAAEYGQYADFTGANDNKAAAPAEGSAEAAASLWSAAVDPASGRCYYFNLDSKETAWLLPAGGRVVARVIPRSSATVKRLTGLMAAVSMIQAKKRAKALAASSGITSTHVNGVRLEGYMFKADGRGKSFKWRWIVVDAVRNQMTWYYADPAARKGKGAEEPVKGHMSLTGASVSKGVSSIVSPVAAKNLPCDHALTVLANGQALVLGSHSEDAVEEWMEYLQACIAGKVVPASKQQPGDTPAFSDKDDSGDGSSAEFLPPPPGFLSRQEGWLNVSTPNGRAMDKVWVALDPDSRLLIFFSDPSKAAGTEVAVVDMLAATVTIEPPAGGPGAIDSAEARNPCLYISIDEGDGGLKYGIYGPPKPKEKGALTCTLLTASNTAERDVWLACLAAACDPSTVQQLSDASKAAAATSSSLVSPTLLHCQKAAGFFSSLGNPYERKVTLNAAERCLQIYADAKEKGKPAATLKLEAPGVRIDFLCDAAGEKTARDWSRLRLEISAPLEADKKNALQTHVFRVRSWQNYTAWASALASL